MRARARACACACVNNHHVCIGFVCAWGVFVCVSEKEVCACVSQTGFPIPHHSTFSLQPCLAWQKSLTHTHSHTHNPRSDPHVTPYAANQVTIQGKSLNPTPLVSFHYRRIRLSTELDLPSGSFWHLPVIIRDSPYAWAVLNRHIESSKEPDDK